jgi:hypothetical protein
MKSWEINLKTIIGEKSLRGGKQRKKNIQNYTEFMKQVIPLKKGRKGV